MVRLAGAGRRSPVLRLPRLPVGDRFAVLVAEVGDVRVRGGVSEGVRGRNTARVHTSNGQPSPGLAGGTPILPAHVIRARQST